MPAETQRTVSPDSKSKADLCGLTPWEQHHLEYFCQGSLCNDSTFSSHRADTSPPPQPPCLSFHHSPFRLFIWSSLLVLLRRGGGALSFPLNLIKGHFKMAMTEPRSCQIAASFFPFKISCLSQRHHFHHLSPSAFNPSIVCLFRLNDCNVLLHWEARLSLIFKHYQKLWVMISNLSAVPTSSMY